MEEKWLRDVLQRRKIVSSGVDMERSGLDLNSHVWYVIEFVLAKADLLRKNQLKVEDLVEPVDKVVVGADALNIVQAV